MVQHMIKATPFVAYLQRFEWVVLLSRLAACIREINFAICSMNCCDRLLPTATTFHPDSVIEIMQVELPGRRVGCRMAVLEQQRIAQAQPCCIASLHLHVTWVVPANHARS